MPDFHNPTGRLLDRPAASGSPARCAAPAPTAVVDETFAELWLDAPPPPPLAAFGAGTSPWAA